MSSLIFDDLCLKMCVGRGRLIWNLRWILICKNKEIIPANLQNPKNGGRTPTPLLMLWRHYMFSSIIFSTLSSTDCPWGNNANVLSNALDSFCLQSITTSKCTEICTDPQTTASRALGWKCCKACVDVCNDAPSRDSNFEDRYPAVYP